LATDAYALPYAVNRRRETDLAGSGLQPEPCSLNKRYPVEQSQRPQSYVVERSD